MGNGKVDININSKSSIFIFALITLIATPIHELGHLIGYKLSGIPARFNFIYTESISGSESLWGVLGGPLLGLLLALTGCVLVYIFKDKKYTFICIYFAITMCLTRLIPYFLISLIIPGDFAINDEGLIAKYLNFPVWSIYIIFMILFVSIIIVLKIIQKDKFNKCFKYACLFYFIIMLFEIKIY